MSGRDKQMPSNMAEAIAFAVDKILSGKWTASAGIVDNYAPTTRRASVTPTPRAKYTDDTTDEHPLCLNVPVLFPSAGGWTLAVNNIPRGEPVLLIFCRRGIQEFKRTFKSADPSGGIMEMDAAVAIAGFGAMSIVAPAGISLQKNDGSIKVDLSDTKIEVKVGYLGGGTFNADGSVSFKNGASITASGQFVSNAGVNSDTHLHHLTESPHSDTGAPVI